MQTPFFSHTLSRDFSSLAPSTIRKFVVKFLKQIKKKKKKENFYKLKIYISVDPGKLDPYFKNSNSDKTPV